VTAILAFVLLFTNRALSANVAGSNTASQSWPQEHVYRVQQNPDDGTEQNDVWYADGFTLGFDYLGKDLNGAFMVGLRFNVADLAQGQTVKYARLRVAAQGGECSSGAHLVLRGVSEDSSGALSAIRRPSELPKTAQSVEWQVDQAWESPGSAMPLYCATPNIADIINEILARPSWGQNEKALIFTIEDNGSLEGEVNVLQMEDSYDIEIAHPAILEVYPTLGDAFVGKPMLGRPTDTSVTVNVINLLSVDIYIEYGTESGIYSNATTPLVAQNPGQPMELVIESLQPNTRYYYRIRYKEPNDEVFLADREGCFQTQRPRGSRFTFDIMADSHQYWGSRTGNQLPGDMTEEWRLYERTLNNIASDIPDFVIDLGDFVDLEAQGYARNALTFQEVFDRYLEKRKHTDMITYAVPFYLVLGNHEAEQGWRTMEGDDLEEWATQARKQLIPNPLPNGFYSGNQDMTACCGLRGDYYAWEWGDALFVVLDPFWYTTNVPHWYTEYPRVGDGWEWTLGKAQYDWLYTTLHNSTAAWKFVFSHQLTGGVLKNHSYYGRGGIEAAKYRVDFRPSFEWGGEDAGGNDVFATKRPGWAHGPIHDMMVAEGVNVFFHGHDQAFVYQNLDGVIYLECPRPLDCSYSDGFYADGCYIYGVKRNSSGHLRVTVAPELLDIEYVRSVLPEDEPLVEDGDVIFNGDISYPYSSDVAGIAGDVGAHKGPQLLQSYPDPFDAWTRVRFYVPYSLRVKIDVYDVQGRMVCSLVDKVFDPGLHEIEWDGSTQEQRSAGDGVYFYRMQTDGYSETRKVVLLH
jgi:hypothetical protein